MRIQPEVLQHLEGFFDGLIESREIIANHQGTGACHEDEALEVSQVNSASTGYLDFLFGKDKPEAGDRFENFERRKWGKVAKGSAGDWVQKIQGNDMNPKFL